MDRASQHSADVWTLVVALLLAFVSLGTANAEDVEPDEAPRQQRLGPLQWQNDAATLGFSTRMQFRSTSEWREGSEAQHQVNLHRLRPLFTASLRDGQVRFKLFMDVAPRALELIDGYVDVRVGSGSFRLGVAKTPFLDHWRQSYADIPFVDWGLATRYFGGGRQLGLRWASNSDQPLAVQLGVYTGHTLRGTNAGRFATLYGEARRNYLSFREPASLDAPHPEFVAQVVARGAHGRLALSTALDVQPERYVDEALRISLDGEWSAGVFGGRGGAYFSAAEAKEGLAPALAGAFAEAYVQVGGRIDIALRYVAVVRTPALLDDIRDYANAQWSLNPPEGDLDSIERPRTVRAQHELTAAMTVYQFGRDLKWAAEATWSHFDGPSSDDFRLRLQCQAGF